MNQTKSFTTEKIHKAKKEKWTDRVDEETNMIVKYVPQKQWKPKRKEFNKRCGVLEERSKTKNEPNSSGMIDIEKSGAWWAAREPLDFRFERADVCVFVVLFVSLPLHEFTFMFAAVFDHLSNIIFYYGDNVM